MTKTKKPEVKKKVKPGIVRSGKNYFTDKTQLSILDFVDSLDRKERETLYTEQLEPVFKHLIENVVFTFGYNNLSDLDSLKEECLVFLLTVLPKFDKDKISPRTNSPSKAFTYITVITKNWLYHESKKQEKIRNRNITFEDIYTHLGEDSTVKLSEALVEYNDAEKNIEKQNFNCEFIKFLDKFISESTDDNLLKYVMSIKELFVNSQNIDIFTKRSINFQICELSGLSSGEIYICANKFKNKYKQFLTEWNNGNV